MSSIINIPVSEEKKKQWATQTLPALLYFAYALLVINSVDNGFFWDSILQASQYGQWFYHTNFRYFFYPGNLDAGYSPLFGMLLASAWKIFGYNLVVSHLLMLPFALGIVHQVLTLSRKILPARLAVFAALLALADPTLLAQITQVSPDVILVFLYIFCLNQLTGKRRFLMVIALVILGLISLRGTLSVASIFLTDVFINFIFNRKFSWQQLFKIVATYVPAFIIVSGWMMLHYQHTGWIGHNPDPNWSWSEGRRLVPFADMLRNGVIIVWRMLDFGRLFLWLGLVITVFYFFRNRIKLPPETKRLFAFAIIPFLVYSLVSLPYSNPIGHRYYLVVFLTLTLLVCYLLAHVPTRFSRRFTYGFMLVGLLTGHFWIYPDSVAKGWDATLAHTPYFKLRHQAIAFLDGKNISLEAVGSDFPNLAPASVTDLNNDTRHFKSKDLKTDQYILYSNIFNGFSDEELAALKARWLVVKSWESGQVKMILYKRPE